VLCRRSEPPAARSGVPAPLVVLGTLIVALCLLIGVKLVTGLGSARGAELQPRSDVVRIVAASPASSGGAPSAAAARSTHVTVDSPGAGTTEASGTTPTAASTSATTNAASPNPAGPPAPSPEQLSAALRATPITLYGASWCPSCRKAHAFLEQQGLPFRDVDVDQPAGNEEFRRLAAGRSIPVVIVDGTQIVGFNPERIMTAALRSVERRLGITGLRLEVQ